MNAEDTEQRLYNELTAHVWPLNTEADEWDLFY